jgi:hypothetical protein
MANPQEQDKVLAEYPPIGKYKIRLIEGTKGKVLDVREFIQTDSFSGYTRRGVRLQYPADVEALAKSLADALASHPAPAR